MAVDLETSYRTLEFILRQPVPDEFLFPVFTALPFPTPPPPLPLTIKKSILIRCIACSPFSSSSLLSIELLHQLHPRPSHLLQSAYCAVAVGYTLAILRPGDLQGFLHAVEVTWQRRIGDAEAAEAGKGLISAELLEWRLRMKMATRSRETREEVVEKWDAAAGARVVMKFLKAELEEMGPTYLERAAEAAIAAAAAEAARGGNEEGGGIQEEQGDLGLSSMEVDDARREAENGGNACMHFGDGVDALNGEGNLDEVVVGNETRKSLDGCCQGNEEGGGVPAEQGEVVMNSRGTDGARPEAEIDKVVGNLKTSLEDLHNIVEDPLQDAKMAAERLIASRQKEAMHLEEQTENLNLDLEGNQDQSDVSAPLRSCDKEVIFAESTNGIELNKDAKKVSSHSLMDWNPTARTYEWEEESVESGSDDSSSKIHLSSPRRSRNSPLKPPPHFKKIARRRKRFSLEEENALREAVNKYGKGNWKTILNEYRGIFEERTVGDLKDKWRNMTK